MGEGPVRAELRHRMSYQRPVASDDGSCGCVGGWHPVCALYAVEDFPDADHECRGHDAADRPCAGDHPKDAPKADGRQSALRQAAV